MLITEENTCQVRNVLFLEGLATLMYSVMVISLSAGGLMKNLYANKNICKPLFFFFFNLVSPPRRLAYTLMNCKIKSDC